MSKEKAPRRAEERAKRSAPHPKAEPAQATPVKKKSAPVRTARQERQRRRMIAVGTCWLLANALIWLVSDSWNARWLGLTLTTIAVPLVVFLLWDPEGRTGL